MRFGTEEKKEGKNLLPTSGCYFKDTSCAATETKGKTSGVTYKRFTVGVASSLGFGERTLDLAGLRRARLGDGLSIW